MDKKYQIEVIRETVSFYGADAQLNICIEELSELAKELCKAKRGIPRLDCIAEEMADVKIIMEQLGIIFENANDVERWYTKKIARLKERLEADRSKDAEDSTNADVVQIVRCKDCAVPHNKWVGCPKLSGLVPPDDFYCAYGERMKGGKNDG